jgi:large subunit ribosomal protein L28
MIFIKDGAMSARCQVTGRTVSFGNAVSHSHRRTRRRWSPNIQVKTYYLASEHRRIKLRVSAKGIKVIDRDGVEAVVARLRQAGERI